MTETSPRLRAFKVRIVAERGDSNSHGVLIPRNLLNFKDA